MADKRNPNPDELAQLDAARKRLEDLQMDLMAAQSDHQSLLIRVKRSCGATLRDQLQPDGTWREAGPIAPRSLAKPEER